MGESPKATDTDYAVTVTQPIVPWTTPTQHAPGKVAQGNLGFVPAEATKLSEEKAIRTGAEFKAAKERAPDNPNDVLKHEAEKAAGDWQRALYEDSRLYLVKFEHQVGWVDGKTLQDAKSRYDAFAANTPERAEAATLRKEAEAATHRFEILNEKLNILKEMQPSIRKFLEKNPDAKDEVKELISVSDTKELQLETDFAAAEAKSLWFNAYQNAVAHNDSKAAEASLDGIQEAESYLSQN
jgi:hypothetical protein